MDDNEGVIVVRKLNTTTTISYSFVANIVEKFELNIKIKKKKERL